MTIQAAEPMQDYRRRIKTWQNKNPLRLWRENQGLSVRAANVELSVSAASIQAWERGQNFPNMASMSKLARATRVRDLGLRWQTWLQNKPKHPDGIDADAA